MQLDVNALNVVTMLGGAMVLLLAAFWPGNAVEARYKVYIVITLLVWGVFLGHKYMSAPEPTYSNNAVAPAVAVKVAETEEARNIREFGFKPRSQTIGWDEAKNHIGDIATIEGVVVQVASHSFKGGGITYLNIGHTYSKKNKDRFQAIVWAEDTDSVGGNVRSELAFPSAVQGKRVQVTGKIKKYKGVPEVEISRNSQVKVADDNWEELGYNDN